jgi:hypothetical protein
MRNPNHSRKFHKLVENAKAFTKVKIGRYVLIAEWIIWEIYDKPTEREMELINIHLEAMAMLRSNQGIDSTDQERYQYMRLENYHYEKIGDINPGYYNTIKIQIE